MINKGILIIFLIFGIILIIIEVTKLDSCQNVKSKVIYKYIPRSFEEEQNEPVYPSTVFATMFSSPSQWDRGIEYYDYRNAERVNKFFISQM